MAESVDFKSLPVGCRNHFFDSGSFSLWKLAKQYTARTGKPETKFYDTKQFWSYIDAYRDFVVEYADAIDHYANVDAIGHPELTWRNQVYLERDFTLKSWKPVPVVHYRTDIKWFTHYIERGYDYIGVGGLVGSTSQAECRGWIDRVFDLVCDAPDRLPRVRLHGFGVTSYDLLIRYPWYSVDSSSWTLVGANGGILVPHFREGKFVFTERPYVIKMSRTSPEIKKGGNHFETLRTAEKRVVLHWLELVGVPLGVSAPDGTKKVIGVTNDHMHRKMANVLFFEKMRRALPSYPWAWKKSNKTWGFTL